jgi:diketogulonate reductase-like aldo/keto reductase
VNQAKENLGCLDFELSEEQVRRLDNISEIELGFPHDFLARSDIRKRVYGGMYDSISFDT